ncbi:OmpA family protein [Falsiroseomonas selenitidurans]|uniref:OmpA family protein n=1 Tax=Falsiroseomonas selenitidurans TaxID=2716335 RepID=A0ABX1EA90_9PROT|nr:OmpA family protein [Falsiroseomonas selenitidurans]NKC34096.1 OmpA family protein [Falsiroseomonas selenitidurans]
MRSTILAPILLGVLLPIAPQPGWAQSAVPGVQSLIEGLDPATSGRRGIRVPGAPAPAPGPATANPVVPAPPPVAVAPDIAATTAPPGAAAVSLTVTFASGSASLSPRATEVLDNLGRALVSDRLSGYRFRVEGHTDTVGPSAMNQELSERRAAAVRDFLVQRHGVASQRLQALGLGEQQLLVATPDETSEPRNRRVQVVNLGG